MSEEKLLPCPFCGSSKVNEFVAFEDTLHFVECFDCESRTTLHITPAEARAAWNRRAGAQWSAEPPTEKGAYWLMYSHLNQPAVATVSEFQYGANVYLPNGNMPKLNSFCKKHPEARWLPIATPPLPGKEDTK